MMINQAKADQEQNLIVNDDEKYGTNNNQDDAGDLIWQRWWRWWFTAPADIRIPKVWTLSSSDQPGMQYNDDDNDDDDDDNDDDGNDDDDDNDDDGNDDDDGDYPAAVDKEALQWFPGECSWSWRWRSQRDKPG